MEAKVHFKLHKVKKQWVTIAVSSLALGATLLAGGQVQAEENLPQVSDNQANHPNLVNDSVETSADLVNTNEVLTSSATDTTEVTNTTNETGTSNDTNSELASNTNQDDGQDQQATPATATPVTENSDKPNLFEDQNHPEAQETPSLVTGGQFSSDVQGNWYYTKDGQNLTGAQNIDGFNLYFHEDGKQAKGEIVTRDGKSYYYDKDNGRLVTDSTLDLEGKTYKADADGVLTEEALTPKESNRFIMDENKNWYYLGQDGKPVTGLQIIDGYELFFHEDGKQAKNEIVTINGDSYYFDKHDGRKVRGKQYVDRLYQSGYYYFDHDGKMLKDHLLLLNDNYYYYDKNGHQLFNGFVTDEQGNWYYMTSGFDGGRAKKGFSDPFGFSTLFINRSYGRYDERRENINGQQYYFDPESAQMVTNQFIQDEKGQWSYFGHDGKALHGLHTLDGYLLHFGNDGKQYKGRFLYYGADTYYFDKDNGRAIKNQFKENNPGNWYYFGWDGKAVKGLQVIDGQELYFQDYGAQVKGELVTIDGNQYYFDPDTGNKWKNRTVTVKGTVYNLDENGIARKTSTPLSYQNQFVQLEDHNWYYFDEKGQKVTGFKDIDQATYYFDQNGKQIKGRRFEDAGNSYVTDKDGKVLKNTFYREPARYNYEPDDIYYAGADGAFKTGWFEVDGNRYYGSTYAYDNKVGRLRVGAINFNIFDENGKLLTNGFYPYFKKTGANSYRFVSLYLVDENGEFKEGFHDYQGQIIYSGPHSAITSVVGWRTINNHLYYFEKTPMIFTDPTGKEHRIDISTLARNKTIDYNQLTFTFDDKGLDLAMEKSLGFDQLTHENNDISYFYENGKKFTGFKTFGDFTYYFNQNGKQVKGTEIEIDGKYYQFDKQFGIMTRNKLSKNYIPTGSGRYAYYNERYYGDDGAAVIGTRTIDGYIYQFGADGNKITSRPVGQPEYQNRFVYQNGNIYYFNDKGEKVTGFQTIEGKELYFDETGKQIKGQFVTVDDHKYYFDPQTGEKYVNRNVYIEGHIYNFDAYGIATEEGA